jgi:hypothetical protein
VQFQSTWRKASFRLITLISAARTQHVQSSCWLSLLEVLAQGAAPCTHAGPPLDRCLCTLPTTAVVPVAPQPTVYAPPNIAWVICTHDRQEESGSVAGATSGYILATSLPRMGNTGSKGDILLNTHQSHISPSISATHPALTRTHAHCRRPTPLVASVE